MQQLLKTRFSAPEDLPLPALAEHLGVTLSVLEEATALRRAQLVKEGKPQRRLGSRALLRDDYELVRLRMPDVIYAAWQQTLTALQVQAGALLRSLIHHFLLMPLKPRHLSKEWVYQGKIYRSVGTLNQRNLGSTPTRITRGARAALDVHAAGLNVKTASLLRGLVTDFLEGRVQKMKIISFPEMWGDKDRYLFPERFG